MKKLILLLVIIISTTSVYSQEDLRIKINTKIDGSVLYYSTMYKEYSNEEPYIETFYGKGLSLYIKMTDVVKYDSIVSLAYEKYKEWVISSNENGLENIEKVITTFKSYGSMINDYGYKSGGEATIEFVFVRKKSYKKDKDFKHELHVKAFQKRGAYSGLYNVTFEEEHFQGETMDSQIERYRNAFNYDLIMSQVEDHKNSLSVLN